MILILILSICPPHYARFVFFFFLLFFLLVFSPSRFSRGERRFTRTIYIGQSRAGGSRILSTVGRKIRYRFPSSKLSTPACVGGNAIRHTENSSVRLRNFGRSLELCVHHSSCTLRTLSYTSSAVASSRTSLKTKCGHSKPAQILNFARTTHESFSEISDSTRLEIGRVVSRS